MVARILGEVKYMKAKKLSKNGGLASLKARSSDTPTVFINLFTNQNNTLPMV